MPDVLHADELRAVELACSAAGRSRMFRSAISREERWNLAATAIWKARGEVDESRPAHDKLRFRSRRGFAAIRQEHFRRSNREFFELVLLDQVPSDAPGPEEQLIIKQRLQAVEGMPEPAPTVVNMTMRGEGLPTIARALGKSIGWVCQFRSELIEQLRRPEPSAAPAQPTVRATRNQRWGA